MMSAGLESLSAFHNWSCAFSTGTTTTAAVHWTQGSGECREEMDLFLRMFHEPLECDVQIDLVLCGNGVAADLSILN